MYEHTVFDVIFAWGNTGYILVAIFVFGLSFGLSWILGCAIDAVSGKRT